MLIFQDVDLNVGGGYSSVTGLFRAPYAGVYSFMATLGVYGDTGKYVNYALEVNGQQRLQFLQDFAMSSYDKVAPMTAVLRLAPGETVNLKKTYGTGLLRSSFSSSFSGFLVDPDVM